MKDFIFYCLITFVAYTFSVYHFELSKLEYSNTMQHVHSLECLVTAAIKILADCIIQCVLRHRHKYEDNLNHIHIFNVDAKQKEACLNRPPI